MDRIPLVTEERLARCEQRARSECPGLWTLLDKVKDPEIPVLSIWDLGLLQEVELLQSEDGRKTVKVIITPTYSGCPAMREIENDIRTVLAAAGYPSVQVQLRLAPAWSTDWMTAGGRERLRQYGIAPPAPAGADRVVQCPRCGSDDTACISEFGSTACKALYKCNDCLEPFDYFKCI